MHPESKKPLLHNFESHWQKVLLLGSEIVRESQSTSGKVRETCSGQGELHFHTVGQGKFSLLIIIDVFMVTFEGFSFSKFYF